LGYERDLHSCGQPVRAGPERCGKPAQRAQQPRALSRTADCSVVIALRRSPPDTAPSVSIAPSPRLTPSAAHGRRRGARQGPPASARERAALPGAACACTVRMSRCLTRVWNPLSKPRLDSAATGTAWRSEPQTAGHQTATAGWRQGTGSESVPASTRYAVRRIACYPWAESEPRQAGARALSPAEGRPHPRRCALCART